MRKNCANAKILQRLEQLRRDCWCAAQREPDIFCLGLSGLGDTGATQKTILLIPGRNRPSLESDADAYNSVRGRGVGLGRALAQPRWPRPAAWLRCAGARRRAGG